jgi:hypothetical protein
MRSHLLSFCCASNLPIFLGNAKSKERGHLAHSSPCLQNPVGYYKDSIWRVIILTSPQIGASQQVKTNTSFRWSEYFFPVYFH